MRHRRLILAVGIAALLAAAGIGYRLGDAGAAGLVLVGLVPGRFLATSRLRELISNREPDDPRLTELAGGPA